MVCFRKRLTAKVPDEINEIIVQDAKAREKKEQAEEDYHDDKPKGGSGNGGAMILDATCAPSHIRYPQDVSLLSEARESAEKLLNELHDPADGRKPRSYRENARKNYLKYIRCRKHTAKQTHKAIGKQLNYLRRDLAAIDGKLALGKPITPHQAQQLDTLRTIYKQQSICTTKTSTVFRTAS